MFEVLVPPGEPGLPEIWRVIPFILNEPEWSTVVISIVAEALVAAICVGITEEVAGVKVPLTILVTNNDPPPFSK